MLTCVKTNINKITSLPIFSSTIISPSLNLYLELIIIAFSLHLMSNSHIQIFILDKCIWCLCHVIISNGGNVGIWCASLKNDNIIVTSGSWCHKLDSQPLITRKSCIESIWCGWILAGLYLEFDDSLWQQLSWVWYWYCCQWNN